MCLSIPSQVVQLHPEDNCVTVDTLGVQRRVSCMLLEEPLNLGDYVLLHIGFVMSKIDEEEAQAQMDEDLALEEQEEFNEEMQAEADPDVDPYLIDYAEFCKKSNVYDKVDLYYYRLDDILCDTKDTVMQNPEDVLGWDWMKEMQKLNTAFVRNEKLKIDYEIYPISGAFSDEVTSRLETDKERKYRRIARQKKAMDDIATEHIEDRDEEGEYVIARPQKSKAKSTARRSSSIDYSSIKKIKSIEDAEDLDDEEE